jgi:phosphoglycolate phosphatase-like HAD superfamily hydrolase
MYFKSMEKQKKKPIIATNIEGLLIENKAFIEPHKVWFERAIKKTKDNSLKKWIGREDYFIGVNEAMEKLMPSASKEERTYQARKWYQRDVVKYIKSHPEVVKKDNAKRFMLLKEKYKLILVTSNTKDYINKILKTSNLEGIYDIIISSKTEQEPDKEELIGELIKKYGKPVYYITGKPEDKINSKFEKLEVKVIGIDDIAGIY